MKVLVACERSQVVQNAFFMKGADAWSCDLEECLGLNPDRHIKADAKDVVSYGNWDLIIAHPPCTYLSNVQRWMYKKDAWPLDRYYKMLAAREFFMFFYNLDGKVCIENPRPMEICNLPKQSLVLNPYEFGEPYSKKIYLWLKNLPPFLPTDIILDYKSYVYSHRGFERSIFFRGIAEAMADCWCE